MANVELELNHDVIEALIDEAMPIVDRKADEILRRANHMREFGSKPYKLVKGHGPSPKYAYKGGRQFAMIVADDVSTKKDNAKNNTLLKALG